MSGDTFGGGVPVATTSTATLSIPLEGHTHLCFMSVLQRRAYPNFCGLQKKRAYLEIVLRFQWHG